ncbi:MAG: hypothetical protein RMJ97_04155 [Raineya sp.]|nr:hypothetical protein [Raineya sp.]
MKNLPLILLFWGLLGGVFAQEKETNLLETDTIPDLKIRLPKEKKEQKEKKEPKNVYYGKKVRKSFIKKVGSSTITIEAFHYLKVQDRGLVNKYIEEIYAFHPKKKRIIVSNYEKMPWDEVKILHGPYKKTENNKVIEEGFFYFGVKHGRWEKYGKDALDRDFVLLEKTKYYRGFLKESKISYYDEMQKKLKEVIPIKDGKKEGTYLRFHPNGNLAEKGTYQNDVKIGLWVEYYPNGRRKKETIYPRVWYDEETEVQIREYDENGRIKQD